VKTTIANIMMVRDREGFVRLRRAITSLPFVYLLSIVNIQTSGAAVGGKKACIPPNADMKQIVDVFRNYVRDHPEKRHLLAANLAAEAFALAFPCRS
jgi:hypothetical protein